MSLAAFMSPAGISPASQPCVQSVKRAMAQAVPSKSMLSQTRGADLVFTAPRRTSAARKSARTGCMAAEGIRSSIGSSWGVDPF